MRLGYFLSTEEFGPEDLITQARLAEDAGFEALWISDHFHPWNDEQGQSPFVWSVIGALSQACGLPVTTAVTCPTVRIHPAVIAQAAATSAVMLRGRFVLGVGTGEALNEHVTGSVWPTLDVRLEMLEEAVELMRLLWEHDDFVNFRGRHYTVDTARIYTRPDRPPPVYMSAFGPKALDVAARIADGFINVSPDAEALARFHRGRPERRPAQAGTKVCWAPTEDEGVAHANRLWASSRLPGELGQVLPSPRHFEQASTLVTEEMTRAEVPCGPDPDPILRTIEAFQEAGYDELYIANIGPYAEQFFSTMREEVLPSMRPDRRDGELGTSRVTG